MIRKLEGLSEGELGKIRLLVGEAFVSNELFHNWGSEDERREDVLKYMKVYVDFAYEYAKAHHIDVLMVCVDKAHQGKGIARELITFAKDMSDSKGVPLLIDTDMKSYAQMYEHMGCKVYNKIKADNGVTRYNLRYISER